MCARLMPTELPSVLMSTGALDSVINEAIAKLLFGCSCA